MVFATIDWQRPWLTHLIEFGPALANSADWLQRANEYARQRKLCNAAGLPIVFMPQQAFGEVIDYEAHIYATGEVPARDNVHDFFNALMWLRFPCLKSELNQLQATEIDRLLQNPSSSGNRGKQRDAATLFDENAALFISSDPKLAEALKQHHWKKLLFDDPQNFASCCEVLLFGHALLEKLVHPYKAITAHVWCVMVEPDWFQHMTIVQRLQQLDQLIAAQVTPGFASSDFGHLPVLGVPGWWTGQDTNFYDDAAVFRPLQRIKKSLPSGRP